MGKDPEQREDVPDEATEEIRGIVDVLTRRVKPSADNRKPEDYTVLDDLADK